MGPISNLCLFCSNTMSFSNERSNWTSDCSGKYWNFRKSVVNNYSKFNHIVRVNGGRTKQHSIWIKLFWVLLVEAPKRIKSTVSARFFKLLEDLLHTLYISCCENSVPADGDEIDRISRLLIAWDDFQNVKRTSNWYMSVWLTRSRISNNWNMLSFI